MSKSITIGACRAARLCVAAVLLAAIGGCQTARDLVAIPFDMAAHVAVETARLPYDAAKMGAQGLVDVVASAVR